MPKIVNGVESSNDGAIAIKAETTLIHAETTLIHGETSAAKLLITSVNQMIGSSNAATNTTGISGRINVLRKESSAMKAQLFARSMVAPTLAAGVACPAGVDAAWALSSAFATICASAVLTSAFQVSNLIVEAVTTSGVYEIVIYEGNEVGSSEVGRTRAYLSTVAGIVSGNIIPCKTFQFVAGKAIRAKVGCSSTGGSVTVSAQVWIV